MLLYVESFTALLFKLFTIRLELVLNIFYQFTGSKMFVLASITVLDKELQENKLVVSNQVLVQTNE